MLLTVYGLGIFVILEYEKVPKFGNFRVNLVENFGFKMSFSGYNTVYVLIKLSSVKDNSSNFKYHISPH